MTLLNCDHLLAEPPRVNLAVQGFFVLEHVPRDGQVTTPVWSLGAPFSRAFLMQTEINRPYLLTNVSLEIINDLQKARDEGEYGALLRVELAGGHVMWSRPLHRDPFDVAVAPNAVAHAIRREFPHAVHLIGKLAVYYYKTYGVPPTLAQTIEARGALLIARQQLKLGTDVGLEVHGVGPLPENQQLFVDFNIDVRPVGRETRREDAGSGT